jgi:hypothetical protein
MAAATVTRETLSPEQTLAMKILVYERRVRNSRGKAREREAEEGRDAA